MNADAVFSAGRNALLSYVSYRCLCDGAGTNNDMGRKVAFVFALGSLAREIFSVSGLPNDAKGPLSKGVTTAAYGYTALLLGGSEQFAKLAMLVELTSSTIVKPVATALIEKPLFRRLTNELIEGGKFGILARAAGCSDKVALAVAGLFAVTNEIERCIYISWKKDPTQSIKDEVKLFGATAATNWAAGIALRYILSK